MRALGRIGYAEAWALQKGLVEQRANGEIGDTVIVCEHDPVYTVGRRRDAMANVLAPGDVPVVEVERGGDVTWHGPGQVVVYPILQLEGAGRDLHAHMHRLEDLMIEVCADFGVVAGRDPRNTGVWHGGRKLGSVGIACRRWVTWHGLALNVDPDLGYFERINPCGFDATIMTSLARVLGRPVAVDAVTAAMVARVAGW
ncbi:MAG: lipoyl(octanoyl) transferase LipB [Pseudomonadota bacterium]|nr:lipoyl(octanoyl) transferase LipB [Pseudomonadota bacterium]